MQQILADALTLIVDAPIYLNLFGKAGEPVSNTDKNEEVVEHNNFVHVFAITGVLGEPLAE